VHQYPQNKRGARAPFNQLGHLHVSKQLRHEIPPPALAWHPLILSMSEIRQKVAPFSTIVKSFPPTMAASTGACRIPKLPPYVGRRASPPTARPCRRRSADHLGHCVAAAAALPSGPCPGLAQRCGRTRNTRGRRRYGTPPTSGANDLQRPHVSPLFSRCPFHPHLQFQQEEATRFATRFAKKQNFT
jgi:hypothetical protein